VDMTTVRYDDFGRIELDKERKIKVRHRYIREVEEETGKSIQQLMGTAGGQAHVLRALLQGGSGEKVTINRASELIDARRDRGLKHKDLVESINAVLLGYFNIENTPTEDEVKAGNSGEADTPATPGPDSE
jgi:hypothetical protein